jgi:hypothetical protein
MNAFAIRAENATTIESALHAVNGMSREHTCTSADQVSDPARAAEKRREQLGLLLSERAGARFPSTNGGRAANATTNLFTTRQIDGQEVIVDGHERPDRLCQQRVCSSGSSDLAPGNRTCQISRDINARRITNGSPTKIPTSIPTASSGELVLIRGLPGSGKTTMAKVLALIGFEHFEADLFFERDDGTYRYEASRIKDAHAWCQESCRKALANGKRVVIANTFTRLQEMVPYWSMTDKVRVLEAPSRWQNVHGVPPERVAAMAERWEELPPPLVAR